MPFDLSQHQTLAHICTYKLYTGSTTLNAHAIVLATDKNITLLGMLDQIEVEVCACGGRQLAKGPQPQTEIDCGIQLNSQRQTIGGCFCTEALGEKWHKTLMTCFAQLIISVCTLNKCQFSSDLCTESCRHWTAHTGDCGKSSRNKRSKQNYF